MISITKRFTFESAHHLPMYDGKCHNLHGHSYKLEVTVTGDIIDDKNNSMYGMIFDFKALKGIVNEVVIDKYDHEDLNKYFPNPTAENMAVVMFNDINNHLPKGIKVKRIRLWETEDSYVTVEE